MSDRTDSNARLLATGDLLGVMAVVVAGIFSHEGVAGLVNVLAAAETVAPFLLGYSFVAILLDAYDERATRSPIWGARIGVVAGLAGANVGLLLRGLPVLEGGVAWPFPLVITGSIVAVVVAWRLVFVTVVNR